MNTIDVKINAKTIVFLLTSFVNKTIFTMKIDKSGRKGKCST